MGLLDDAIRQHLELKRQHGADPGDVAEQEREALGPVKRGDLDVDTGTAEGVPAAEPAFADDAVAAPDTWTDEPEPAPADPELSPLEPLTEPQADEAPAEPEPFEAPASEPFAPTAAADAYVPAPAEPAPPAPVTAGEFEDIGEPTQEYSVLDDAPDPQADPQPDPATGEHDELEETPDFLEETPEHDRLWFEQKPPRDFDF